MADIHLKQFEANSFLRIDSESPIVIDFTKARKGQNVTLLKSDQETGKTSTLYALMLLMGASFNFDAKNLINKKDETIDIDLKFSYEGNDYQVSQSGNRLSLKKYFKDAGKWISENSPKETLRKMFGSLGVSPMFLKDVDGKKQIEWFKKTFGTDEDVSKKELKKTQELKTIFDQRREVNRGIKDITGFLNESKLYNNYEANQKKFAKPISGEKEKEKLEELGIKKNKFETAKNGLDQLKIGEKNLVAKVERLKEELAAAENELKTTRSRIEEGNKFIASSNGIVKEYEAANEAWLNIGKTLAEQSEWKTVLKKEKELIEMQEASTTADGTIDRLRLELLKITKTYLPEIKGLEIRLKTGLDDEDEGIFYNGMSFAQLSESALWDLFLEIWAEKDVQFIFCENINTLGSEAVKTLNRLVKENKAQVFASEMERSKKEIEITFLTKIE